MKHSVKLYPHRGKRAYIINRVSSGSVVYPDADWRSKGGVSGMRHRDIEEKKYNITNETNRYCESGLFSESATAESPTL